MKVAIHQPECFPWLGFFHKASLADTFVFLDTVQFEKNNFQNRNKIKNGNTDTWLTLPILKHSLKTEVKDIKINWTDTNFVKKHLLTLEMNYSKTPYFKEIFPFLNDLYAQKIEYLADFNIRFITFMFDKLGLKPKIFRSSELDLSGTSSGGTEVTLEICKLLEADTYISGSGAKTYLKTEHYKENNINLYFQEFNHPKYKQIGSGAFIPYLSILDLYFNHGPKSLEIILSNNIKSI